MNPISLLQIMTEVVDDITRRRAPEPVRMQPPAGARPLGAGPVPPPNPFRRPTGLPRAVQPAATPAPQPYVQSAPQPVVTQLPGGGAGTPAAQPALNAAADQLGAAVASRTGGSPFDALLGNDLAGKSPGDLIGLAASGPQDAVVSELGWQMLNYVEGGIIPEGVQENAPFWRSAIAWADQNREEVKRVARDGYDSRDGATRYTGGRAVWERFARDNLTFDPSKTLAQDMGPVMQRMLEFTNLPGPGNLLKGLANAPGSSPQNLPGALVGLATDPLNLVGGPGKSAGARIAGQGDNLARLLLGRAVAGPDIAYEKTLGAVGDAAGSVLRRAGSRVPGAIGRWFEFSPEAQANRILAQGEQARAAKREAAYAAGGTSAPAPPTAEAVAAEQGITLPTRRAADFGGSPNAIVKDSGNTTPGGIPISEPFRGPYGVERRVVGDFTIDYRKKPGQTDDFHWSVRQGTRERGRGFPSMDEALAYIDSRSAKPVEPAAPPPFYQVRARPRRTASGTQADAAVAERLATVGDEELAEPYLADYASDVRALRARTGVRQSAEYWLAEFAAETKMRAQMLQDGLSPGPHINNQAKNATAFFLDTLAWSQDDAEREAARTFLEEWLAQRAPVGRPDPPAVAAMREAMELAEDNPFRSGAPEPAAAPSATDLEAQVRQGIVPSVGEVDPADISRQDVAARQAPPPEAEPEPWLSGFNAADRAAWDAGVASPNGRAAAFRAADVRLRETWRALQESFERADVTDTTVAARVRQYEEAHQEASRLLNIYARDSDVIAANVARNGTDPEIIAAITGGEEPVITTAQAIDEPYRIGPVVAPETETALDWRFGEANVGRHGQRYEDVANEIEARIAGDRSRLIELLGPRGEALLKGDRTELNKLLTSYPEIRTLSDAAKFDPRARFRQEMLEELRGNFGARPKTAFGANYDRLVGAFGAWNLHVFGNPGYYIGNLSGDSWQVALTHGPRAAAAINDPEALAQWTRYAFEGGDPLIGAAGDLVKRAGLGGFHGTLLTDTRADVIARNERAAIARAAGPRRFSWIGPLLDRATDNVVVNTARNTSNGLEYAHRTGLWAWNFQLEATAAKMDWLPEAGKIAQRAGLSDDDVRGVMQALPPVVDGYEVADTFGRLAMRRGMSEREASGFGLEMGRKWASRMHQADQAALKRVGETLFSYEMRNIDVAARRVIPFHFWMSRAIPFYAEQALRHPGMALAYGQMVAATQEQADASGFPPALRNMLPAFTGASGMMKFFSPLAMLGVIDIGMESSGGYTDENVSAVGRVLRGAGQYGFGLLPWVAGALNYAGLMGDSPIGLDPIGTYNARQSLGAAMGVLAAQGVGPLDPGTYLGRPAEQMFRDIRDKTSRLASAIGLPGAEAIPSSDAAATDKSTIRNIMLGQELKERGLTGNQYQALLLDAARNTEGKAAELLAEIHESVSSEELDGGAAYQQAVQLFAEDRARGRAIDVLLPGPNPESNALKLELQGSNRALADWRYGTKEERMRAVAPGLGPLPRREPTRDLREAGIASLAEATPEQLAQLDPRDVAFLRRWQEKFGTEYRRGDLKRMAEAAQRANALQYASPEQATLLEQEAAYYALGTGGEQKVLTEYNKIGFGDAGVSIPGQGIDLSREAMAELTAEARWDLADLWLETNGLDITRIKELRDDYEATHPEWGAFRTWQRETRKQWTTPAAFRVAAARENESYANWLNEQTALLRQQGKPPSAINAALDERVFSLDGYLAYTGLGGSRYDPTLPTGDPIPVASAGGEGGGASSGGSGSSVSWDERVRAAIADAETVMAEQLRLTGTNYLDQPRDRWRLLDAQLPDSAKPGPDWWIVENYLQFVAIQRRAGRDESLEAFIASTQRDGEEGALEPETLDDILAIARP